MDCNLVGGISSEKSLKASWDYGMTVQIRINMVIFHSYVSVYQRVLCSYISIPPVNLHDDPGVSRG